MLVGIIFFSQIMGSFIAIIVNAEISLNADKSDGTELNSWMLLLLRFTTNNNE